MTLLRPIGHGLGAGHDGPLVGAALVHAIAILARALPGRAETVLRELPGAFRDRAGALGGGLARLAGLTGLAQRLARHGAVRLEHHPELDVRGRRRGERLAGEERGLDVLRGQAPDRRGQQHAGADKKGGRCRGALCAHGCPPDPGIVPTGLYRRIFATIATNLQRATADQSIDGSTRSGGLWPSRKVRMLTITFSPMSMRPSSVAEPMCGSTTTLPARASLVSFGLTAGACSNTSRPAPAISPSMIRRTSAVSSITSPRAVLTT